MSNAEDELFADFESQFSDEVPEVEDVSTLNDFVLMVRLETIDEELGRLGELMFQTTDRGRELQSTRAAIRIEQLKRERKAS